MSLIGRALGLTPRADGSIFDERLWSTWAGPASAAGVAVSAESAMRSSAVWGCVRLISESMATLPLLMYRRQPDGGRERADNHPLAGLLHTAPNRSQTAFEFTELMTAHVLLRGNAYAQIVPGPRGPVDQLIPLHPDRVTVETLQAGGLRYKVRNGPGEPETILNDDQVFHIRGLSSDGVRGLSVIEYARESIGLALAAEQYGGRFFGNDSRPGGVLEHPGKLSTDAAKRIRESWEAQHGAGNQHRAAVLEEGLKWQQVGLSNDGAQFLQTREFQVTDIARWFRVPLHMIQETSNSTSWGSGIEQLSLAFVVFTLLPWARRWEQAITRDLILAPGTYYAEFKLDALARGDLQSRYTAYSTGRNWGWLSANDVRRLENMNPIDGGDEYLVPLNMRDASEPAQAETTKDERRTTNDEPQPPEQGGADSSACGPQNDRASAQDAQAAAHYRLLIEENAGRVVRKEIAAITTAARRAGKDDAAFAAEVSEFYREHGDFVTQTMRMEAQAAAEYAAGQLRRVLSFGVPCQPVDLAESAARLAQLAARSETGLSERMETSHV